MKKKLVIFNLLAVFILIACSGANDDLASQDVMEMSFDWPIYENFESLSDGATDVVRAEVIFYRVDELAWSLADDDYWPNGDRYQRDIYTIHEIRILEVFQGNLKVGDVIEIGQLGGETAELKVINLDKVFFNIGDDVVLFLLRYDENFPAGILNPFQGAYHFSTTIETSDESVLELELENVFEDSSFDLEITLEDMIELAEINDIELVSDELYEILEQIADEY